MKKTLLTLALVGCTAAATYAQGTIQFLNSALSKLKYVDAPGQAATDVPVGTVVGVFWGTSADSLTYVDNPATVTAAGLFNGGAVYALPGSNPGQAVSLKIAAWLNKGGTTPRAALQGAQSPGITHYGETAVFTSGPLGPTAGPGTVVFQSATGASTIRGKPFEVVLVPEPSVLALGALGLGALLLRRRKA
jgi:hypothetical protein